MINLQYIICLRHISYLKTKMTTIDRDREEERDRRWGSFYLEVSFRFLLRYEDFVKISKKFMKYLIVTNDMKTRQDKTRHQWKRGKNTRECLMKFSTNGFLYSFVMFEVLCWTSEKSGRRKGVLSALNACLMYIKSRRKFSRNLWNFLASHIVILCHKPENISARFRKTRKNIINR